MGAYFDVSATDRVLMNLTRTAEGGTFVVVAEFDRMLDAAALRAAWYETLHRHPILTCRRPGDEQRRWAPASGVGDERPMAGAVSLDNSTGYSRLRIGIDHAAMDGRGGFYVLETLRDRYRFRSDTRSPDHTPRTFLEVVAMTGFQEVRVRQAVRDSQARWAHLPASLHVRDAGDQPAPGAEVLRLQLGPSGTAPLLRYSRATGTPMTAVLAGAIAVAWERATRDDGEPRASGWLISNDLRPALGYAGGVGNLSGMDAISFEAGPANLRGAIAGAKRSYQDVQRVGGGLASQILAERAAPLLRLGGAGLSPTRGMDIARRRARYTRLLTNLGAVPTDLLDWGDASIRDLYVVPAFKGLPYDVFSVSSFAGSLTVLMRLAGSSLRGEFFAKLRLALEATLSAAAAPEP